MSGAVGRWTLATVAKIRTMAPYFARALASRRARSATANGSYSPVKRKLIAGLALLVASGRGPETVLTRAIAPGRNVRFWVWAGSAEGGYVKLTLKHGQSLEHSHFERTDEGWSSSSTTWTHRGRYITRECCTDGRDCDGRLITGFDDEADNLAPQVDHFVTGEYRKDGPVIGWAPVWQNVGSVRRDYSAEAMGY